MTDFNLVMLEMKSCLFISKVCEDLLVGDLTHHGIKIWYISVISDFSPSDFYNQWKIDRQRNHSNNHGHQTRQFGRTLIQCRCLVFRDAFAIIIILFLIHFHLYSPS